MTAPVSDIVGMSMIGEVTTGEIIQTSDVTGTLETATMIEVMAVVAAEDQEIRQTGAEGEMNEEDMKESETTEGTADLGAGAGAGGVEATIVIVMTTTAHGGGPSIAIDHIGMSEVRDGTLGTEGAMMSDGITIGIRSEDEDEDEEAAIPPRLV